MAWHQPVTPNLATTTSRYVGRRHSTAPRAVQQADREDLAQQLRTLALLAEKLARS
ncbi:MAG: hypothetical protein ACLTXH_03765 [Enterobacter hormaechei]